MAVIGGTDGRSCRNQINPVRATAINAQAIRQMMLRPTGFEAFSSLESTEETTDSGLFVARLEESCSSCDLSSVDTGATNRYPRRGTVSIKRGLMASSARVSRTLLMTRVRPRSKSTCVIGPERVPKFLACNDVSVSADQFRQEAEGLLFEFQSETVFPKFSRGTVELERTETKELLTIRHIW